MDKNTQLFIRACKSESCHFRLKRLYSKRYFGGSISEGQKRNALILILSDIVDTHCTMKVSEFLRQKEFQRGLCSHISDNTATLNTLISKIRFSAVYEFEGLTVTRKLKDRDLPV
jgi:hypothetical protein